MKRVLGDIESGVDIIEMMVDTMILLWKEAGTTLSYRSGISG